MAQGEWTTDLPRKDVVGGSVSPDEKDLVVRAAEAAGFRNVSEFVRDTMLRRSHEVLGDTRSPGRRHSDKVA